MFWAVLAVAVLMEIAKQSKGSKKIRAATDAALAMESRVAELEEENRELTEANLDLQGKLDYARRKARKAGMQAAFDQFIDNRNVFDSNVEVVLEQRRREANKEAEKQQTRSQKRRQARQKAPESKRPWWEVLDVARSATRQEIKIAYRKLAMQWHPDRSHDDGQRMAELNLAKEEAELAVPA